MYRMAFFPTSDESIPSKPGLNVILPPTMIERFLKSKSNGYAR